MHFLPTAHLIWYNETINKMLVQTATCAPAHESCAGFCFFPDLLMAHI